MSVPMMSPRWTAALAACALVALAVGARGDGGPVLHEFVPADGSDAADFDSTSSSGALPAAVHTPSGTITPPDIHTSPPPHRIYQKDRETTDATFQPDRDTRRPHTESYDDPFSPALTPFKRMYAYDAVREDYTLFVRDEQLKPIGIGGSAAEGDDRFFADMMVQLRAGEPVRIPTPGPGARMLKLVTSPAVHATLLRDGADNWFLNAPGTERVRIVAELAVVRDAFASEYPDVPWRALPPVPIQPAAHQLAFDRVARAIGISKQMPPREVVAKMIEYFRAFAPSEDSPKEIGDIYLDLALSKKGVCRHRAFAFLVTALNIGIPTRLVHNEAHAWVEVRDDRMWHRVDLGGAAVDLDDDPRLDRPAHVPPPDKFAWPSGRDSGEDLAQRDRDAARARRAANPNAPPGTKEPGTDPGMDNIPDPGEPGPTGDPNRPPSKLTIDDIDRELFRGRSVHLRGKVTADGAPCANLRVDVLLRGGTLGRERRLGSLSTDERGAYDGGVVLSLRPSLAVGDYELTVATPGNKRCGPGRAP
jgi:transglutaminase-like putative cysteine protease